MGYKGRKIICMLICVWMIGVLTACTSTAPSDATGQSVTEEAGAAGTQDGTAQADMVGNGQENSVSDTDASLYENTSGLVRIITFTEDEITVTKNRFFSEEVWLEIVCPEDAVVYYTFDCREPTKITRKYTEPIHVEPSAADSFDCIVLKARAYYADGTESEIITHTFWVQEAIEERFETIVFSVSGKPEDLTGKDGILYGNNAHWRGRESEREVYIEVVDSEGALLLEQGAGVRPYGGASRDSAIKSMKLFARKEYDPEHGKFNLDVFGTIGADGEVMDKYDKLVLRNYGNDFQFAFIRDELNQRLAAQKGYTDCEAVVPAVVYLNGEYYGLFYLHENYCDDYLMDKYGGGEGHYEVIEGNERYKTVDEDDAENARAAKQFNSFYEQFAYSDLTDASNYAQLCAFMDVENYLQYYAYNIYINNNDWPQNNYKCYRYYAGTGEEYQEGHTDGRWRFFFHDMDFSMGLYESEETVAEYNNLEKILDPESNRYSPLFANLMKREDCREFFIEEIISIMKGPLWATNVNLTLDNMLKERENEMLYFFEHLETLKKKESSIWIWYDEYLERTDNIRKFAENRKKYMERFLKEELGYEGK